MSSVFDKLFAPRVEHPGVSTGRTTDETVTELASPDSMQPALANQKLNKKPREYGDSDFLATLQEIRDLLSQSRQVDVPADFTHPRAFPIPAIGATIQLEGLTQYGYIYFPPQPAGFSVYLGQGPQFLLGHYSEGASASLRIPHVDVVTVVCGPSVMPYTFFAYPSTRPFELASDNARLNRGGERERLTIANGATTSSVLDYADYITGTFTIPSAFTGATVTFQISPVADSASPLWTTLYTAANVLIQPGVAASRAYPLPSEAAGANYVRIVSASAELAARTIEVTKKR